MYIVEVSYRVARIFKRSYTVGTEKPYSQVSADFADFCTKYQHGHKFSATLYAVRGDVLYPIERCNNG